MIGLVSGVSPVSTITDATAGLLSDLLGVGAAAIAVGAGVFVLRRGWSFFKSMAS
jgi:hypothetical protein